MNLPAPRPFQASWPARLAMLLLLAYVVYAVGLLEFSWDRFVTGLDNGARFLGRMFPPDLSKMDILWKGLSESLQIAVLADSRSSRAFMLLGRVSGVFG